MSPPLDCTACPHDYISSPTADRPRRCCIKTPNLASDKDGSLRHEGTAASVSTKTTSCQWMVFRAERIPGLIRWEEKICACRRWLDGPVEIAPGTNTTALVSSLDLVPTILSIVGNNLATTDLPERQTTQRAPSAPFFDGEDISAVLFGDERNSYDSDSRVLFFWRDGFLLDNSPLGPPYGRFDVVAVKVGRIKSLVLDQKCALQSRRGAVPRSTLLFDTLRIRRKPRRSNTRTTTRTITTRGSSGASTRS